MPGRLFFSIIVPAHNEERYLEETLRHLQALDYPADRQEIIVVENGSTDGTLALAKRFENAGLRVLQSGKGVSKAKNLGIEHLSAKSDWVIFLDADTLLEKNFLNELDAFLGKKTGASVGTVSLRPLPDTRYARAWFFIHNEGHMISRTSFAIQILKRSLFPQLRFDETLVAGEDIAMIRQAEAHGTFFYMWTKGVATSTRRFERLGWWYILFSWTFVSVLPEAWQRRFDYEVVR